MKCHRRSLINGRCNRLIVIRELPKQLAVGGLLNIFVSKSWNLLVPVEHQPDSIVAAAFFHVGANPVCAPQRNHIRLRDQHGGTREIAKQPGGLIHSIRAVDHHIPEVCHQQVKQPRQFGCSRCQRLRALRTGKQLQSAFALGHETLKQRGVHAMQVLQRIAQAKRRPCIQMKCGMTQRRKIHQ